MAELLPAKPGPAASMDDMQQQLAKVQAELAALREELSTVRASEASLRAAAGAVASMKLVAMQAKELESFSGSGAPRLDVWLFRVENCAINLGLPEDQRVRFAEQLLDGEAFSWWVPASQRQAAWTWEEFAASIKSVFNPQDEKLAYGELDHLRQGCKLMQGHVADFLEVVYRIPTLTEAARVHCFLSSLHPRVRANIEYFEIIQPDTLDRAMALAHRHDASIRVYGGGLKKGRRS